MAEWLRFAAGITGKAAIQRFPDIIDPRHTPVRRVPHSLTLCPGWGSAVTGALLEMMFSFVEVGRRVWIGRVTVGVLWIIL